MVEEFFLPQPCTVPWAGITDPGYRKLTRYAFTRPFFPPLQEDWQTFGMQLCPTKEMHMIWHYDIAPDCPAMPIMRMPPLLEQNRRNFGAC